VGDGEGGAFVFLWERMRKRGSSGVTYIDDHGASVVLAAPRRVPHDHEWAKRGFVLPPPMHFSGLGDVSETSLDLPPGS
jgi:hypothetical protein